ncbi:MAG TPA: LacI family DNA-binding transcriptional regulator [Firmicutes bacterium]|nr:LacI family DNA-binding transcriptional regulator [Bacillota bacterium]
MKRNEIRLKDIAAQLGVSPSAVSIVMKNKKGVSDETRERIRLTLERYGYSVTAPEQPGSSRNIRFLKYKNSAILVEENGNFVSSIIDSLEEECRQLGLRLIITAFGPDDKEEVYRSIREEPMDGIIVLGTELEAGDLSVFENIPVPLVLVDTPAPGHSLNCVTMNNEEIAGQAVRCLYGLGHREIGYLHSSMDTGNFRSRYQGYRSVLEQLGLPFREDLVFSLTPSLTGSHQEMSRYLERGIHLPGALLADNDMIAIGCSRALKDRGYVLPDDCSVIGIDDIPYSSICAPPLTSVHIPCRELGAQTVRLLHYKLTHPGTAAAKVFVDGQLIVRSSVKPAAQPSPDNGRSTQTAPSPPDNPERTEAGVPQNQRTQTGFSGTDNPEFPF